MMHRANSAALCRLVVGLSVVLAAVLAAGCTPTGKPKWATRLQPAPEGVSLSPAPPSQLVWVHVDAARVPDKAPGNSPWDDDESGPDPLVRIIADKKEILSFPAISDTLKPRWKKAPGGNIDLDKVSELRIELRDSDGLNSKLIGAATLSADIMRGSGARTVDLSPVGKVELAIEPAHALLGLGFDYRYYRTEIIITDILNHGPASRVGIKKGDKLVKLGAKKVRVMTPGAIKSVLNTVTAEGIDAVVLHKKSSTSETVKLREGPIYPLLSEYGPIP